MTTTTETAPIVPWSEVREGQTVLYEGRWSTVHEIDPDAAEELWVRFEDVRHYGVRKTHEIHPAALVAVRPRTAGEGE